jgi:hypothetical protein
MIPTLNHVPTDWQIPWQWWAADEWICPITKQPTRYLAGLADREHALEYGRHHGWID